MLSFHKSINLATYQAISMLSQQINNTTRHCETKKKYGFEFLKCDNSTKYRRKINFSVKHIAYHNQFSNIASVFDFQLDVDLTNKHHNESP